MPARSAHPTAESLEQLAEGTLPSAEAGEAQSHVEVCARCSAELECCRGLFTMLESLPRFAPSPAFAGDVMARVRIAPTESVVLAWLRRFVPRRRRGWVLLGTAIAAPITPIIALVGWILLQPLVTPTTLWQWGMFKAQSVTQYAAGWILEDVLGSYLPAWAEMLYGPLQTIPGSAMGGALALFAIAIPLSAWGLLRLTRTPVESVTYAN